MSLTDRISALSPAQRELLEVLRRKNAAQKPAAPASPPPIVPRPPGDAWPLALDQERLWFLFQLDPADASYNLPTVTRLRGPLDVAAMSRSVDEVVRRHESWRTSFPEVDGRPVQVIAPPAPVPLPLIDLSGLPPEMRAEESRRLAEGEGHFPFDLTRGPLLRVLLVRHAPNLHDFVHTVHHIISDWYSSVLFWGEMRELYPSFTLGRPAHLPELPVQYADFALWQREWLDGAAQAQLDYWLRHLEGAPLALELPTDHPRPAHFTTRGRQTPFRLTRAQSEGLKALAQRERVTPFMLMLALYQTLLSRWSGQDRVLVSSPNANRNREELHHMLGFFLTQLVFATDLAGDPTFRELLGRVRQVALGAFAHQDVPFGKLVEALRPERDTSRPPIVQVDLLVLEGGDGEARLGDLVSQAVEVHTGTAAFELTLTLWDGAAGYTGYLEHNADLFDPATGARLTEGFLALVEAVLARTDAPLSALPVQGRSAAHQALVEWNDTEPRETSGAPLLHSRFFAQAERTPEAVAVIDGSLQVTYAELAARAAALAAQLRRMGVGPEERAAVCLPRSADLVAALLGVLEAGGAYVPLDPAYPQDRLRLMLEDSRATALVTRREMDGLLPDLPVRRLYLEESASSPGSASGRGAEGGNLAYLIYTSGSTGRPKAVGIEHRSAAAFIDWAASNFAEDLTAGVLAATSVCFDLSVFEIFGPLSCGGTVILAENALALPELPAAGAVRLVNTVPSALTELLRLGGVPSSVRTVNLAGEPLPRRLAAEVHRSLPSARLFNLYGPSEDTTYSTWALVPPGSAEPPIGRPVAGTRAYLLDGDLREVPLGGRGELYLGGAGLARGYLGRPELTAERFVPDPFAVDPGGRLYRTGDLARWRPGGKLDFLGRADRQVKVRGFRVEPAEIEALLAALPEVREAAVAVRDGRLAAWVVPSGATLPDLRPPLLERLPRHMVPALWMTLPALPLTPNGKVDYRALPDPEAPTAGDGAPRSSSEERLAAVWAEVLGIPRVGIHDNFFRLGGDSILSIRVVARARQAGLALTPRQIFERQTVAELAAVATPLDEAAVAAESGPVTGEAPLTPIQLWFLETDPPEPHHYNQAVLLEMRDRLDDAALRRAIAALLEHHDALRLRFVPGTSVFSPAPSEPPVTRIDLSALPPEQHKGAIEAAAEQTQGSLDLAQGPLLRAVPFDLGADRPGRLLLVIHHFVVDGVSWRILLEDLQTVLAGLPLPPKTTSWKRWAERLVEHARSPEVEAEARFWLSMPEPQPLPQDRFDFEDIEASAGMVTVALPAESTHALLRDAAAAYRTRPDDLLLAAVARAFAGWTASPRLVLWLEGHGREELFPEVDLSRTVGWFTSLSPVALDASGTEDAAIRRVKEALRAIPSRGVGFGLLRSLGNPQIQSRLAARSEPEVVFNYLGQLDLVLPEGSRFAPAPESAGSPRASGAPRRHRIEINAGVMGGRLEVHWSYGRNVHDHATIETLARRFLAELEALIAHCLAPGAGGWTPSDFPLAPLSQPALDRLLGADRPVGGTIEDVYPLSPLQAGLLFHGLYAPSTEIYFEQVTCTLRGDLDTAAFRRAWQRLVDRHGILRTAFAWEGLEEPLQVVRRGGELPWLEEDWRGTPDVETRLAAFAAEDRRRPFDLRQAPLLRGALLRTGEREHRFVWSFHHLLLDGWSLPALFAEVFALYEGAELPAPRLPFRDFIAWLSRRDSGADERFWREALAGVAGATPIPWDHPDPEKSERADDFSQPELLLPEPETAALEGFARERGLTLNTLVQGAWGFLLSRWSGEREVVFGAVAAGRPPELPGFETAVGLFINTLPVRLDVDPDRPVADWLTALQARQIEARQHEQAPLAEIQRWSGVSTREPLFQSLLVFENYPVGSSAGEGASLELDDVQAVERTNYPISLAVVPGRELRLRITHDRRLEPATGRRLLDWLARVLAAFAAGPERSLGEIDLLSDAERHRMLVEWNDTAVPPLPEARLDRLFRLQAASTPEAPALRFRDQVLTFREMEARVNRLAARLRAQGVGPDVPVVLLLERGIDQPLAAFAVLAAGGAFVPLDPAAPRERLAGQIASCGAPVIIDREWLRQADEAGPEGADLPEADLSPENLAYVIFTSGSTGTPKGTLIRHRSVANLVLALRRGIYGEEPGLRVALNASLAFDGAIKQLIQILSGHCLDVLPEEVRLDPVRLPAYLADHAVDAVDVTPSQLRLLLIERGLAERPQVPGRVLVGGESLDGETWTELADDSRTAFFNVYGPTECTVDTTAALVAAGATPHIGRPLANMAVYLLDRNGRPVPPGAVGQLFIGGMGLARGYMSRPDLTGAVFVPDPFSGLPGARLYATGDLGRFLPDGRIEIHGRADRQVKIRGYRIEPGEIEAVLRQHAQIREAAVVVPDISEPRLAAWIVLHPGVKFDRAVLRPWLQARLPEPMVPSDVGVLDELPRTISGKIDRRALAALAPEMAGSGRELEPPANDVEEKLAGLWRDLLGAERVGRRDNFFDLGGHSLRATQLMVRIRTHFGVEIPLTAIFETEDMAALAHEIVSLQLRAEDSNDLAELMSELDGLSEDEVQSLLAEVPDEEEAE